MIWARWRLCSPPTEAPSVSEFSMRKIQKMLSYSVPLMMTSRLVGWLYRSQSSWEVLGATDPATAEDGAIRKMILDKWEELGLKLCFF